MTTSDEKRSGAPLTPLELAIERKMRELARAEAPPEKDARAIALLVVRHWGDDAPRVMNLATEFVRDEVGRWAPDPSLHAPREPTPKTAPSRPRRRKKG